MADENAVELIKRGDARFAKRQSLDSFRQEVALNFAPWLAAWTTDLQLGDDFAAHLVDGTPLMHARDFKAQTGSMLRPAGKQWAWQRTAHDDLNNDREARDYLDWRSRQMFRILFDNVTGAHRALEQTDWFFSLFGDAVLSVDYGRDLKTLRLQSYHSKDAVWAVGEQNKVDVISRKEQVPARVIKARYGRTTKLHENIEKACEKDPDTPFEIRHEVLPADEYDAYRKRDMRRTDGFVSVWVDAAHKQVLRESSQPTFRYVVPRWVTMPHTPYAISPATTIALPDARLIQQQALAILEAAEKQVNPPIVAASETFRGTPQLKAYTINYYDREWSGKDSPLYPIELAKNFNLGVDSLLRTEQQIRRAFYLDILRMPDTRNSKSTIEVQFLIDEYVRAALPLFAPMQVEYNEALLREVDTLIEIAGGYGRREKPKSLQDEPLIYQWDNPLTDMLERQKVQMVTEVAQVAQTLAALEAAAAQAPALKQINPAKALRETIIGIGGAGWLLSESEAKREQQALTQQASMQQAVAMAPNIAQVIDSGVNAAEVAQGIPLQSEPGMPLLPAPV